jgi:hypothetical protein
MLGERLNVLPCAGITLIRFYGFDLSPGHLAGTPRETLKTEGYRNGGTKLSCRKDKNWVKGKTKNNPSRSNFPTPCVVLLKTQRK